MKKYLKYDADTLFVLDENEGTSKKVHVGNIQADIDSIKAQIANLELIRLDNIKLLKWAKDNFDFVSDLNRLRARLVELQMLQSEMVKL